MPPKHASLFISDSYFTAVNELMSVCCRNIKRIVFYSLIKPSINEKGEKEMNVITPATALQIAGRAGRYASHFIEGEVTTFSASDLPLLQNLLKTPVELIQVYIASYCEV